MPDLDRVESLFHEALGLPTEVDRRAWLAAVCGDDTWMFREVSTLLDARAQMTGGILAADPVVPRALFGPYRAIRLLGRGGMSAVYLAERADGQFQQNVAVKVMAGYLAGSDFSRRFEAERQFLAALNHRNITRLLDGGVSSAGDPFLVTEYVDGAAIDRYCEDKKLGVVARLRIVLQVADAVDYAHRNLVVHRDLKPANIMVNTDGEVKLLDFGTASLAASQSNPTVTRMRMMTPRYASPEQLRGERVNIATDVFSLGVILYELLTGAWPFGDPNSVLREMDRATGHMAANFPPPVVTAEAAQSRSNSRQQLRKALEGDLSAIMMKALEADPARRYESVRALAADIGNFLEGRPVAARPQTALYRAGKFLRRRWLAVSAAAVFVLGLATASLITLHQARVAQAEAAKAQQVNDFLNGMLGTASEGRFDPKTFTVAQMLEAAEERFEKSPPGDRRVQATLRRSLGNSYFILSRSDRAKPQLEKALALFRADGDEVNAAWTQLWLADMTSLEGRSEQAVEEYEQVLENVKRLGKGAPPRLLFTVKDHLGDTLSLVRNQRLPEARKLLEEAVALGDRDVSIPRIQLAGAIGHLAMFLETEGKTDEAEARLRQALAIGRREDPDGIWQADLMYRLGVLVSPRNPEEATAIGRERYEVFLRNLGPDNAQTASARILWSRGLSRTGQAHQAAAQVLEAMEVVRRQFPSSSMNRWVALASSAFVLNQAKRFAEAESMAREMFPIVEANRLADDDPRRAESWRELGKALYGQKKGGAREAIAKAAAIYDAAGPTWRSAADRMRKILSEMK